MLNVSVHSEGSFTPRHEVQMDGKSYVDVEASTLQRRSVVRSHEPERSERLVPGNFGDVIPKLLFFYFCLVSGLKFCLVSGLKPVISLAVLGACCFTYTDKRPDKTISPQICL